MCGAVQANGADVPYAGGTPCSGGILGTEPGEGLACQVGTRLIGDSLGGRRDLLDLQALANLGEFISGLVVIASLAYVAVQVRQNPQSLRTENYARALDRVSAMQSQMSRDGQFSTLFSKGVVDPSTLSRQERIQFTWWAYEAFGAFEFMFHQAQSHAIPDEVWERWSATTAWWLSFPGIRALWAAKPAPFSASFSAFVDTCIRDNPVDSAAARRWQEFVRGREA